MRLTDGTVCPSQPRRGQKFLYRRGIQAEFRLSGSWEVLRGRRPFIPTEGTEGLRRTGLRQSDFRGKVSLRDEDGRKLKRTGSEDVMLRRGC